MDAKRFLWEYQRMCDYYNDCDDCPLSDICGNFSPNLELTEIDKIVDAVEKWSEDHKRKTNFQKLKEMFPDCITIVNDQTNVIIHSSDPDFWKKEFEEDNKGSKEMDKIKRTRLDVFNGWLKEQGVDPDAYICIDRMVDIKIRHSCFGFVCPINTDCKDCPNNGFWAKEVEVREEKGD